MKAPSAPSLASKKDGLLSQFDVYCVRKPRPTLNDTSKSLPLLPEQSSLPLTYRDVVAELESDNWSFAPYPRCDRGQLLQVHAYWVAVPKRCQEKKISAAHLERIDDSSDMGSSVAGVQGLGCENNVGANRKVAVEDLSQPARLPFSSALPQQGENTASSTPRFSCVVGVVWVRLSPKAPRLRTHPSHHESSTEAATAQATGQRRVEGYLQVVLTHPNYRRQGMASWLLRTCLADTTTPAAVFASHTDNGEHYAIQRWRLHTLMAPTIASKAKHRRLDGRHNENINATEKDSDAAIVKATLSMYRQLCFTERRFLYKYYGGQQDAVELIKECP
ncbi:hypothetical protein ABB37_02841 [Leptomonas pyrrhocoris]|uniref:Uncharacterized protein n=1 Tax=Leptomonas pyrrhocoris TaxID=157538 RepID=A0A0N0VGI9_LEPPY|nr:hypothetical protein ABB37_02841 [Leptomonas pyrrhocoris]KPA83144.1 hypothetical protein ABB37_02841 [Leptomonas pyrrhocoris]|eukprot:XP_015661583.1 hypothetical protein ABB37_02841 [Leptomonas pyrrhocoris]